MTATISQSTAARNQTNTSARATLPQSSAKQVKPRGFLSALLRALSAWAI